jgi:hypothetical protein
MIIDPPVIAVSRHYPLRELEALTPVYELGCRARPFVFQFLIIDLFKKSRVQNRTD